MCDDRTNIILLILVQVAIAAAEHLTPVCMELGGKDPAVILPDTDLEKYSSIWMRGV